MGCWMCTIKHVCLTVPPGNHGECQAYHLGLLFSMCHLESQSRWETLELEVIFEVMGYSSILEQRQKLRLREIIVTCHSRVSLRAHVFHIIDSLSLAFLHQRGHSQGLL